MGKLLLTLLLGTGMIALSVGLFDHGLLTSFYDITAHFTNPQMIFQEANGQVNSQQQVFTIIKFIISVGAYYMLAAILVFTINIFMPKEKKN